MSNPDIPDISVVAAQLTADCAKIAELKPLISHQLVSNGHSILTRAQFLTDSEPLSPAQEEALRVVAAMVHEIALNTDSLLQELITRNAAVIR